MNVIRWEPFREMEEMFRQYAPLLGRTAPGSGGQVAQWRPVADISETDKEYLIKAELPEVRKEDVKITIEDGVITISGERKQQHEERNENEIRVESIYGSFARSFVLPEDADTEHIRAESKDGVLRIHIPKAASKKAKQVSVQVQ
jgi:HSP20 family protein